jgi:radical SAM protein with 4Fe4S-binding SPASM domain
VVFRPALPPGEVAAYYARPALPIRRRVCYAPWTTVDVRPDGSAVFCPDYPDYAIGNVREEPLLRIWNGERAQKFRRSLLDRGLFPICARCCGLYDHGF